MSNVAINIAAEFTGKKAFKQAETATEKMTKSVKNLAGAVGLAFGTQQVIAFGKASVKAAAADQKAQQQLALALKNVGLGRDAANSEEYIQRLQSEFGIVDDLLRPAYQTLAIATRDTAKSQNLLNVALDISAATGKDLGSVTTALSRAYLGNNTALTRLGVGISKADLKTKSFEEIVDQLGATFAGSATAAANTFQGSIDKLGVASANVQEIIGTGLIDALKGLGDVNTIDDLSQSMESAALYTADVIRGIGVLTQKLQALPGLGNFNIGMIPIVGSYLEILRGMGKQTGGGPGGFPQGAPAEYQSGIDARKAAATAREEARARAAAAASAAKLAAMQKKTLKSQQDQAKLAKARAIFDLQKIQIEAALKGKLSEEDRTRLLLMKAIEDENISNIEKYTKLLDKAQEKVKELQAALNGVKTAKVEISMPDLAPAIATLRELKTLTAPNTIAGFRIKEQLDELTAAKYSPSAVDEQSQLAAMRALTRGAYDRDIASTMPSMPPSAPSAPTVIVNVEGSVIAENNLAQVINDAIANSNWAGSAVGYSRQADLITV